MIGKREILETASALGLLPSIVEKDYVLGWLLAGINEHPELTDAWCGAHPALGRSNESGCHTAVG